MKGVLEISDLTYKDKDKIVFDNLNIKINKNTFTTIIGPNNCGKTLLSKIMLGLVPTDAIVTIDGIDLNQENMKNIYDKIEYIPDNVIDSMLMDTVKEEITFNTQDIDEDYLRELLVLVGLSDKLEENPRNLSYGEKQLVYIVSCLIKKPTIIICDDAFSLLDNLMKDKILKYFKRISKEKKTTIINFTNDPEDILYGEYVAIMDDHKVILNEPKEELYDSEKLFKKVGLKIPFMIELSNKLKYYNLLQKSEINMNRMVNKLWK